MAGTNEKQAHAPKPANRIALNRFDEATAREVLRNADSAQPTAVVAKDGKVIMTVGLNGRVYFPKPSPDPLDEVRNR